MTSNNVIFPQKVTTATTSKDTVYLNLKKGRQEKHT